MRRIFSVCRWSLLGLCIAAVSAIPYLGQAQDVELIGLIKGQDFVQDNADVPRMEEDDGAIFFNVFVEGSSPTSVSGGSLLGPVGPAQALMSEDDGLDLEHDFDKLVDMDSVYPAGAYQLTVDTENDGQRVLSLTMTADNYPNIPRISNFDNAQLIDASAPFTVTWDAFAGGTSNDIVILEVRELTQYGDEGETVFETALPGEPGALDGTSVSAVIPPGTLVAGEDYEGELIFGRLVGSDFSYTTAIVLQIKETAFPMRTIGGSDTNAPSLYRSRPADYDHGVAVNSALAFVFDEPMDTALDVSTSISWTGLDPVDMNYSWSADGRTLYYVHSGNLPMDSNIGWMLNPSGSPMTVRDASGNLLPADTGGQFYTENSAPGPSMDVEQVHVFKAVDLCQSDNAGSVVGGAFFEVDIELPGANTVYGGTLSLPGGGQVPLEFSDEGDRMEFEADYATQADMEAFLGNGTYSVALNGVNDGAQGLSLNLSGNVYPPDFSLSNYDAAQAIDPTQPFTLVWGDFSNGTSNDPVFVEIEDESGTTLVRSPSPDEPGGLNGATAQSWQIPANALYPGRTYTVEIVMAKLADMNETDYVGVTGLSAYMKVLEFEITTTGTPVQPVLWLAGMNGGSVEMNVTGEPNRSYAIDVSTDLVTWRSIDWRTAWGGTFSFEDYDAWSHETRFYRARDFSYEGTVRVVGQVRSSVDSSPVVGAVISTSLDGVTAVTDSNGNFSLITNTAGDYWDVDYEIRVEASGFQNWAQSNDWGNTPWEQIYLNQ